MSEKKLRVIIALPIDSYLLSQILKAFESEEEAGMEIEVRQMADGLGIFSEVPE